jgi:hypothetical protein
MVELRWSESAVCDLEEICKKDKGKNILKL